MTQKSWIPTSQPPAFYWMSSREVLLRFNEPDGIEYMVGRALLHHFDNNYSWAYRSPLTGFTHRFQHSPTHWMDLPEPPTTQQ